MINFNCVTKEDMKEHDNANWPEFITIHVEYY